MELPTSRNKRSSRRNAYGASQHTKDAVRAEWHRDAKKQRSATQRNATQRDARQRKATQRHYEHNTLRQHALKGIATPKQRRAVRRPIRRRNATQNSLRSQRIKFDLIRHNRKTVANYLIRHTKRATYACSLGTLLIGELPRVASLTAARKHA